MIGAGICSDVVTYNSLIKGGCVEAVRCFDEMVGRGIAADMQLHSVV